MQKDYLKEVVSLVAGKPAEPIADILDSKKHVNEFLIAKKMELTINQVRNLLYKFSDYNLVSSIRKKDKKKGWYTYFWKFEKIKCLEFLKNYLSKRIEQIKFQLKSRKTKQFYICERCKIEFNEENALLNNFTCNECGDVFVIKEDIKLIKELSRLFAKRERELEFIEDELEKEEAKLEKLKKREQVKEAKKKKVAKKKTVKKKKTASTLKNLKGVKGIKKKTVKKKKVVKKKATKKKTVKDIKKKVSKKKVAKKK